MLAAQIAPQRSTQYTDLAATLAPHELALSPLGPQIATLAPATLGGQHYLLAELRAPLDPAQRAELGTLATLGAFFEYCTSLGDQPGPWLRPIETDFVPRLPADLLYTRRYKGKTNEVFTQFLLNIARHASAFGCVPWRDLRVIDPLAGGGTTLLAALVLGADAAGVDRNEQDMQSTAVFLRQFAREEGIPCRMVTERLRGLGHRWSLTLGWEPGQRCILAHGATAQADALLQGFHGAHLLVADLPYGIQHQGPVSALLAEALPVWTGLLLPGGTMALAWDATRFGRSRMVDIVSQENRLAVLDEAPWNALAHRVDRVIRRRDVLVARRTD